MITAAIMNRLAARISTWRRVSTQRRELRHLSDHLLKDIALSRIDADREAHRPFWQTGINEDVSLRINHNQDRGSNANGRPTPGRREICCP